MTLLSTTSTLALLLLLGLALRRRRVLSGGAQRDLSVLVVDFAFPALVLWQLPRTVDAATLVARWYLPLLGAALIGFALLVGRLTAPAFAPRAQRRTFAFLVGTPNWIFFPLPIAEGLYGAEGVSCVLLINVGAQLVLWTLGVLTLQGRLSGAETVRGLLRNPGLLSTLGGLALVVTRPELPGGPLGLFGGGLVGAVALLGQLAVPLSFLVAGMQLAPDAPEAGTADGAVRSGTRVLAGLAAVRLVLAPALFFALVWMVAPWLGLSPADVPLRVACLVAAMPAAVTCGPLAERLGGDAELASRGIVVTTLLALASVPALLAALDRFVG